MAGRLQYPWKRFWSPRGASKHMADGGYMPDTESTAGRYANPAIVSFESIAPTPCLILLGEPGSGKSTFRASEWAAAQQAIQAAGGQALFFDLHEFDSGSDVRQQIFGDPAFGVWQQGPHQLHLFLDSLDECLLQTKTVTALLSTEFKKKTPHERLFLRIACRTAEWRQTFEDELKRLWGEAAVAIYELAPLRREDVRTAARLNGVEPDAFLDALDTAEVVPLAIKPITLDFLLKTYRTHGHLPSTQKALYEEGCRRLCEERNLWRVETELTGTFKAEQRMNAAAGIAATTVFAPHVAIWMYGDPEDAPEKDLPFQALVSASQDEPSLSEPALKEALATGLFSSRGPQRLGWAHQTYAEFLAAYFLIHHELTLHQIMELLLHRDDAEEKLVPQLHEVAAWVASMRPDVFRRIMEVEPEVLLRSDAATAEEPDRAALVQSLLTLYDEGRLFDFDLETHRRYHKLAHPGLSDQLRPFIVDPTKGDVVRRVAIEIAAACHQYALQEDLLAIALDVSQSHETRKAAAHALLEIGSEEAKGRLKPLALGIAGDDPNDSLKGYGLLAVWPHHLTAHELFTALTPPKRGNYIGAYQRFLAENFMAQLPSADLPVALQWAIQQKEMPHWHSFHRVIDDLLLHAWEQLDTPGVLEAFARAALSRLQQHNEIVSEQVRESLGGEPTTSPEPSFRQQLLANHTRRRQVLEATIPLLIETGISPFTLCSWKTPLVTSEDTYWLLAWFQREPSQPIQQILARLIWGSFDRNNLDQLDTIVTASPSNPILAEMFGGLYEAVPLDSPEAQQMRAAYRKTQAWQERPQNRPLLDPPPVQRVALLLNAYEAGNSAAWEHLCRELTLTPESTTYEDLAQPDLTTLPGWSEADTTTRARIVTAAKRYLLEHDPKTEEWFSSEGVPLEALAGYKALLLLWREDSEAFLTLPLDMWKRWIPIMLSYPLATGEAAQSLHDQLIQLAYRAASDELITWLLRRIDQENRQSEYLFCLSRVDACWDTRLAHALLEKASDPFLKSSCLEQLLGVLLEHQSAEAKAAAASFLAFPLLEGERTRAVVAASALIFHAEDAGWSIVWPVFQHESAFGKQVLTKILLRDAFGGGLAAKLTEEQLADLCIWLVHEYPPYEEEPPGSGFVVGVVTAGQAASWLRDSVLGSLKGRGTPQSCLALRRVVDTHPELPWLKASLLEAQRLTRQHQWTPYKPQEILALPHHPRFHLVQNGAQLLDVLLESLARLEAKLQRKETPRAIDLWNENPDEHRGYIYAPKDENRLSDYIKSHLEEDIKKQGIIVNREVEIRRGGTARQGQRTDIHVDAVTREPYGDSYDRIIAIIEIKGCWYRTWQSAIETQLVNRYLRENNCQYGIYLVGWFQCEQWDAEDQKKRRPAKMAMEAARALLTTKAAELSNQGMIVRAVVLNTALPKPAETQESQ